jgi:hypothetical protein
MAIKTLVTEVVGIVVERAHQLKHILKAVDLIKNKK